MAEVNSVFQTVEGDRFKFVNKLILGVALLTSISESDTSGVIAVLGILTVVIGNVEILGLYLILTPLSIVFDVVRLILHSNVFLILFDILEILLKLVGIYFGWSLWRFKDSGNLNTGHSYQQYQGQGQDGAVQQSSEDPFASYPKPQAST
eukprot:TRINITY_DN19054_c0_g2_i1.p2 TRINITY_DN19054_c0_g2~~TRINITY_DN19054_c0_g2_i1.p2  ORF type:complete len:150 (+),score=6.08 TRINITY_DN19054_c0_g2_i1:49-498(+)